MARNFGIPESMRRFWNEQTDEMHPETRWAFVAIGAAVLLVVLFGIFLD